jgi:hypothetical protein
MVGAAGGSGVVVALATASFSLGVAAGLGTVGWLAAVGSTGVVDDTWASSGLLAVGDCEEVPWLAFSGSAPLSDRVGVSWTAVAGAAAGIAEDWAFSAGVGGADGVAALPQATASSRTAPRMNLNIRSPCQ